MSSAIYGLMITAVSMIAGALHGGELWHLLGITLATNMLYFLTHLFAEAVVPAPEEEQTTLRHHAWVSAPILTAAFTPMLITAIANLCGLPLLQAVWVGLGWDLLGFVALGWLGLRRRGYGLVKRILIIAVVVAIMALLILGKLLLHKG